LTIDISEASTCRESSMDGVWIGVGNNGQGQLGDGSTSNRSVPVPVQGLSGVVAVAADTFHSLAVRSDGTVWTWGYNSYGQLGNGPPLYTTTVIRSLLY
jgi:alpha-tubulin suppressor-like RCC1 family protein